MASRIHDRHPIFDIQWLIDGSGEAPAFIPKAVTEMRQLRNENEDLRALLAEKDQEITRLKLQIKALERRPA